MANEAVHNHLFAQIWSNGGLLQSKVFDLDSDRPTLGGSNIHMLSIESSSRYVFGCV